MKHLICHYSGSSLIVYHTEWPKLGQQDMDLRGTGDGTGE